MKYRNRLHLLYGKRVQKLLVDNENIVGKEVVDLSESFVESSLCQQWIEKEYLVPASEQDVRVAKEDDDKEEEEVVAPKRRASRSRGKANNKSEIE